MARIADKYGLTNKYRSDGKRLVKRGRRRKYLFGAPSRKGKTYRSASYKETSDYDAIIWFVSTFIVFFIIFLIIPFFRCFIPFFVGVGLEYIVEEHCKKSWGLPTGRWSKPLSIGWTILTAFAMVIGFFFVILIQTGEISSNALIILALVYLGLSILILYRKYTKVKKSITKNNLNNATGIEDIFDDEDEWI